MLELKEPTFHKQTVMLFTEECRQKEKEKQKNLEQEEPRWQ